MRLDIAALSDVGRRKKKNEDSFGVYREDTEGLRLFEEGALVCVADGLGGHAGGEIASKLSVSILRDVVKHDPPPEPEDEDALEVDNAGPLPILRDVMQRANASIYQSNRDNDLIETGKPMGTTLLAAIIEPRRVYIGNVGDSRCYHIREGEIIDRTEDHSWVDEQVKQVLMSKAEAETDRRKNIVTRCVGTHEELMVDTYRWHIVPGDILLLCTDGLVNMVTDADIKEEFRRHGTAADIAQRLVHKANENGGKDNVTVVLVMISPSPLRLLYLRLRSFLRRHGFGLLWLLFLIVYGLAAFAIGYFVSREWPELL